MKTLLLFVAAIALQSCAGNSGSGEVYVVTGPKGETGAPGSDGKDGQDGSDGKDGKDAELPPYSTVKLLAPCAADPNNPTAVELQNPMLEVLLKLANNQILASFSENINGLNTHFAIVPPGTYRSTGAGGCVFTVNANGTLSR